MFYFFVMLLVLCRPAPGGGKRPKDPAGRAPVGARSSCVLGPGPVNLFTYSFWGAGEHHALQCVGS